jgi:hypothetical protein
MPIQMSGKFGKPEKNKKLFLFFLRKRKKANVNVRFNEIKN